LPVGWRSLVPLVSIRQFIDFYRSRDERKNQISTIRLVVDDNPEVRETVGYLLAPDCAVQGKLSTGKAALKEIPRLEPDIAIIDISLRDMSGFGVVR
jgi:CheY-like chemotaxis protein